MKLTHLLEAHDEEDLATDLLLMRKLIEKTGLFKLDEQESGRQTDYQGPYLLNLFESKQPWAVYEKHKPAVVGLILQVSVLVGKGFSENGWFIKLHLYDYTNRDYPEGTEVDREYLTLEEATHALKRVLEWNVPRVVKRLDAAAEIYAKLNPPK
jgi:hypothetical protein